MPIHQSKSESGQHTLYHRELDGIYDLSDIAMKRIEKGEGRLGSESISGDSSFTGTKSLEEAVELCNTGWPEGVERISKVVDEIEINPELLQSASKLDSYFDVSGDEPDIDRYLQGEPENMITYVPSLQTHGTMVDIVLNVSQPGHVKKRAIINRGAAILAAVEALRAHGYSVGVTAVDRRSERDYYYDESDSSVMQYVIPILEPGEAINVDTLAFSTMHPSFLRRLIFAANEAESDKIRTKFGFMPGGGYGIPLSIQGYVHERPAFIIDKDDGLVDGESEVKKFAQNLAQKCLETLRVDSQTGVESSEEESSEIIKPDTSPSSREKKLPFPRLVRINTDR